MHYITPYVNFMDVKLQFLVCGTYSAHDVAKLIFIIIRKIPGCRIYTTYFYVSNCLFVCFWRDSRQWARAS
jgi:hypothetical protein